MRTSLVRSSVLVALGILILWVFTVSVGAADKSAGPVVPPAGEMKQAPEDTPLSLDTAPGSGRRDAPPSLEIGGGGERPMNLRDTEEGSSSFETQSLSLDADVLDHIRMQDEISSVSF